MSGIGHNGGPSMEAGFGFRKVAWTKARAALIPKLPLEIVRVRVARAQRLGLPYKTYASIRAASGRDVVAFLFSSNTLGVTPKAPHLPICEAERLIALRGTVQRLAAVAGARAPEDLLACHPDALDYAARAPRAWANWADTRADLARVIQGAAVPRDGVVLISDAMLEADWVVAGGLAGRVSADVFFGRPPSAAIG